MLVHYTTEYPNPLAMRAKERTPVIRVLARDGSLIAERGSTHDFMPIDMLPQHVIDAVVATEDRRFFTHWGIDPAGMARAAFANLRAGRFAQGGSTLTQQLAKNLFLSSERTVGRKLDELALAIWLEVRLSKREILELYLNRVYFGGGAYGIEAASQRYFDKSARALNVAEAALIAGLLKAPSKYAPTASPSLARARGHVVLDKMREAGHLTDADHAKARRHKVQFAELKPQRTITGFEHAIDHVLDKLPALLGDGHGELIVETSIDPALQRRANEIVANALGHRGKAMGANEAALVALDREGGIRALVGGQSYEKSQFNRAVKSRRQPGTSDATPAMNATVPAPWSVPVVPLMRAVRPNPVTATMNVSRHLSPRPFSNSPKAPSRPDSNCARRPRGPPSLACVSQPSKASAATRGPSGAASRRAAPRAACAMPATESMPPRAPFSPPISRLASLSMDRRGDRARSCGGRNRRRPAATPAAPSRPPARRRAARAGWRCRRRGRRDCGSAAPPATPTTRG